MCACSYKNHYLLMLTLLGNLLSSWHLQSRATCTETVLRDFISTLGFGANCPFLKVNCCHVHAFVNVSGPMKERELTPGTVFPVLGTLLFFLPERYREKLCCVTPLAQKVISNLDSPVQCFSYFAHHNLSFQYYPCLPAQRNRHPALSDGQERQQRSSLL